MESFYSIVPLFILVLGYLLDRILGDPLWLPHPIRWMGKAIEKAEPVFRRNLKNEMAAGLLFSVTLILSCWLVCALLLYLALSIHPFLAIVVETVMIFYSLSSTSLAQAAKEIHDSLTKNNVDLARNQVAMIVGRDVQSYQADDIARATVETVAENFVDGVVSPLFFAALGGGPLALAYKMVNTLDSMVGYKNQRYLYFGRAAARIDDGVNYIPARLSLVVIGAAAQLLQCSTIKKVLQTGLAEGKNHSSPNAGYPEAAFAEALGVKLNGPNYYGGVLVEKPFIGIAFQPPGVEHIVQACQLLKKASLLALTGGAAIVLLRIVILS